MIRVSLLKLTLIHRGFSRLLQRLRGFNLIELSIVLGVIMLVIAGIWIGANAVIQNWRVGEVVKFSLQTVEGVKKFYPPALWPVPGPPNETNITDAMERARVIPPDWQSGSFSDGTYRMPFGTNWYGAVLLLHYPTMNSIYISAIVSNRDAANKIVEGIVKNQSASGMLNQLYCADVPETQWWFYSTASPIPNCPPSASGNWAVAAYYRR